MSEVNVPYKELTSFCVAVLEKSLPKEEAEVIADSLVDAELLGVRSHGVARLSDYLKRLEEKKIENKTDIKLLNETATTALYDASNGWGQTVSVKAMNTAIDKALEYGTGFVGVTNSNHYGTASYYTRMAAKRDCIGISMTNASPIMVPFGAKEPSLGTNPISITVPAGEGRDPIMLDMATSNAARGKINLANKKGESIPEGWAITVDGEPTTDPVKALEGFVLPFGPKGSGLGIMVDIFSGVLTGSLFGMQIPRMYEDKDPQQLGHFFGAISIEAFMEKSRFYQRMQEKINETVTSKPAKGFDRVRMPGEIELALKKNQEENGVQLSKEIFNELLETAEFYHVNLGQFNTFQKAREQVNTN